MNESYDDKPVKVDVEGRVAVVTLNSPDTLNALSPRMVVTLAQAWDEIQDRREVAVVLLRATGGRAFCVGADLKTLIPLLSGARDPVDEWDERVKEDPRLLNRALLRTSKFTVPIVSAVNGYVLAGGMELMLACDVRIAGEGSMFGLTEVSRGLIPGGGGLTRLSRQVGYAVAAQIVLTGEQVSAGDALQMGLINAVVPEDKVLDEAESLAQRMAKNAPMAMRKAKEALVRCAGVPFSEALRIESALAAEVLASDDAREGPRAFAEKRVPNFKGA